MFQRVGVPVLGIVENMSWFECPHCGKPTAISAPAGAAAREELDLPLLGQVPLYPRVMEGGDTRRADRRRRRRGHPRRARSARSPTESRRCVGAARA